MRSAIRSRWLLTSNGSGPFLVRHSLQRVTESPDVRPGDWKVAAALPNVTVATFSGASHIPHVTHPDAYVEAIMAFIRKHPT